MMVSEVAVAQAGVSVVALALVGKSIAVAMAVVGIPVVVESIGMSFRSSGSSGLGISGPLARVVSIGIGVSVVAGVGEAVAVDKRVAVVAVVGVSLSIGLSCHGGKEAKSSNGHGFHHI